MIVPRKKLRGAFKKTKRMKKKRMTTHEKIKYIKEMLTIVEAKISELNQVQRELIRELESIRKEMEMERLYD